MKILIVENEVYLAQSIANKLSTYGYECECVATVSDALKTEGYEVVLLSTNISGQNFLPVIHHFKQSIILLMVSYINNDTVAIPLKEGAKDYIVKPFMIEELIRKIELFIGYKRMEHMNSSLIECVEYITTKEWSDFPSHFPCGIISDEKRLNYALATQIAYQKKLNVNCVKGINFLSLSLNPNYLYLIEGLDEVTVSQQKEIYDKARGKNIIFILNNVDNFPFSTYTSENNIKHTQSIMEVEAYVQTMIKQYESKYSDTDLAKYLGISRKSLWEKRRKYDLPRKK